MTVCHQEKAKKWAGIQQAKKMIFFISLISVLYNIPRFLCWKWDENGKTVKTDLYNDKYFFEVYRVWLNFITQFVIPLIVLIVLNALLFKEVKKCKTIWRFGWLMCHLQFFLLADQTVEFKSFQNFLCCQENSRKKCPKNGSQTS